MAEWARVANTSIDKHMKGVEDELGSKQIVFAGVKKEGNIVYNESGVNFTWRPEYREAPMEVDTGEDQITPARQDIVKTASLTMKGVRVSDSMTLRERLMNGGSGPQQIVNYYQEMSKRLGRNLRRQFALEVYTDASATGNAGRVDGLETMFATNGTITISSGAQRSYDAADVVYSPNDTYAGLLTNLQNYGGSWDTQSGIATTWPAGKGSLTYDFWTPIIVNYLSTALAGSGDTWATQAVQAMRYLITHMQRYDVDRKSMKAIILDRELYRPYLDLLDAKEQIIVSSENSLKSMGFKDVVEQDGMEVTWEYGVPGAAGYGLNFANMELHSYRDKLFETQGPTHQPLNSSWYTLIQFHGNWKFNGPRHFGKLKGGDT